MPTQVEHAGRAVRRIVLAVMLLSIGAEAASAQTYSPRPIRIVVPLPPGSNGDLMPRILGQHLAAKFGRAVVIENRSGAVQVRRSLHPLYRFCSLATVPASASTHAPASAPQRSVPESSAARRDLDC
jgi:hypothetical protein